MLDYIEMIGTVPEDGDVRGWLAGQMNEKRPILLAFADDGVIWGRWQENNLVIALDAPALRDETLQQAFVFGRDDEVRLFREETGAWKALRVADGIDPERVIVESQILWGDKSKDQPQNGFVYASEYRSGIPGQYLPLDEPIGEDQCARLEVHHLVEYDKDTGEARIALSRLAGLSIGKRDMEVAK